MIEAKQVATDILGRLKYYKSLGDKTFAQLEEKDFFWRPNGETNSIAIIIQHLYGNMMSRFTNFLTEDGEKPWRRRDAEFEAMDLQKQDLMDFWETGWSHVFSTIQSMQEADMTKDITIRGEVMKAYDALLRQLGHYPYHVGQIVFIGKMLKAGQFRSLSIPRGGSMAYTEKVQTGQAGEASGGKI